MALHKELTELVAHSIISQQTAQDIERYYAAKQQPSSGNLLLTIFGIVGSALVGLGIILIFAHNWDNFTKPVKAGLAFLPLAIAQGLAAWCIFKKKSAAWKESAATLLFFAVGACIALIAQIYNLPGDMSSFLCTWTLLCLPLAYVLQSRMSAIITIVFATCYAMQYPFSEHESPWMYLVCIAALLPLYIINLKKDPHCNFVGFLGWLLPLSAMASIASFIHDFEIYSLGVYMALACLTYNISKLPALAQHKAAALGYKVTGILGMAIILFISSFDIIWIMSLGPNLAYTGLQDIWGVWGILLVAAIAVGFVALNKTARINIYVLITAIYPLVYLSSFVNSYIPTVAANLLLLAMSLLTIKKGIDRLDFRILNFGLLVIAILVTCRFFDLNVSFAIRGLLFVAVGAGFFAANYILAKRKRNNPLNA